MSKMDRQLNSKKDKDMIYEIYRACRLCGAGAGYKMPIIQNVVDLDDSDVELKQKVRDCVQIEVHQDDKMPPLICELCVDKVNDFYEFLEMCRQTNKRTRLRLGLPPQSMPKGAPDVGECILGLTEPVFVNEDSDGEPLSKQKKLNPKVKIKREPELKVQLESKILTTNSRASRFNKRAPTPPRITRHRANSKDDKVPVNHLKEKPKPSSKVIQSTKVPPKSILKKEIKIPLQNEDNSLLIPRLKRSRDKEPVKLPTPKRVKIQTRTPPQPPPKPSPKSSPRLATTQAKSPKVSPKVSPKRAASPPPPLYKCSVCGQTNKTSQGNMSHMKVHTVGFTSLRVACNPCGLWFVTAEEASGHHRQHRNKSKPYTCRRCDADFIHLSAYDEHFENKSCIPFDEVPDVKCEVCWHLFATNKLLDEHKCLGEDHRPGGKCGKCKRSYALLKNLKKHEQGCTAKKKGELIVAPALLSKLKPIQIRVSRCDPLLSNHKQEHYDVSNVTSDFGLDRNCVYPYISSVSRLRIKSDPDGLDRMVDIRDDIKNEFYIQEDYVHWDSEDSESDAELTSSSVPNIKKIDTLANLTLKILFSKKCLGKVPKKKRRVKQEKSMFDSLLAETEDDVTRDINNIIDNLGDDDDDINEQGQNGVDVSQQSEEQKSLGVSDDKDVDVGNENGEDTDKNAVNDKNNDNVSITDGDQSEKNEDKAQNDKLSDVIDGSNEKNDSCNDVVSKQDVKSAKENYNSIPNDKDSSNSNLNSDNKEELSRLENINNGHINNFSFDYDDGVVYSKNDSKVNNDSSSLSRDENQNDGDDANNQNDGDDAKNEDNNQKNNQDSETVSGGAESLLKDNDVDNKETIDNATSLSEQNPDIEDDKSQSNDLSVDNLSQDSTSQSKMDDSSQPNEDVNENDYTNAISVIVNTEKAKISTESEESEDSRLMAALDAQIGEGNGSSREQNNDNSQEQSNDNSQEQIKDNSREKINDNFNDKIALDDLITPKSSDMDMIPEEFSFDA